MRYRLRHRRGLDIWHTRASLATKGILPKTVWDTGTMLPLAKQEKTEGRDDATRDAKG